MHHLSPLRQRSNIFFPAQQFFWTPQVNMIGGPGQRRSISKSGRWYLHLLPRSAVTRLFSYKSKHPVFPVGPDYCHHRPECAHLVETEIGCRQRRFVRKRLTFEWAPLPLICQLQLAGHVDCSRNQKPFYHRFGSRCDCSRTQRQWYDSLPCSLAK